MVTVTLEPSAHVTGMTLTPHSQRENFFPLGLNIRGQPVTPGGEETVCQQSGSGSFGEYTVDNPFYCLFDPVQETRVIIVEITERVLNKNVYSVTIGEMTMEQAPPEGDGSSSVPNTIIYWTAPAGQPERYEISHAMNCSCEESDCEYSVQSNEQLNASLEGSRPPGTPVRVELALEPGSHCVSVRSFDAAENGSEAAFLGPFRIEE